MAEIALHSTHLAATWTIKGVGMAAFLTADASIRDSRSQPLLVQWAKDLGDKVCPRPAIAASPPAERMFLQGFYLRWDGFNAEPKKEPVYKVENVINVLKELGVYFPPETNVKLITKNWLLVKSTERTLDSVANVINDLDEKDSGANIIRTSLVIIQTKLALLEKLQASCCRQPPEALWQAFQPEIDSKNATILQSLYQEGKSGRPSKVAAVTHYAAYAGIEQDETTSKPKLLHSYTPVGISWKIQPEASPSLHSISIDSDLSYDYAPPTRSPQQLATEFHQVTKSGQRNMVMAVNNHATYSTEKEVDQPPKPRVIQTYTPVGTIWKTEVLFFEKTNSIDVHSGLHVDFAAPTRTGRPASLTGVEFTLPTTEFHAFDTSIDSKLTPGKPQLLTSWIPTGTPEFEGKGIVQVAFLLTSPSTAERN